MSGENVEIVRRAFDAFNREDLQGLEELLDADHVMDWSRSIGPNKGVYNGIEGIREWVATMRDAFETFEVTPVRFIGSGDLLIVPTEVHATGRGSGVAVEAHGATLCELRDGKLTRLTLYQNQDDALEAAGLSE
jgi:ketosteroid isomerase-like protein